ncbi:M48 family metallopeptidase [Ruminococcus sp.]|uniref:M48 metallopeptidase family protein n=1 Tax=Ruminococcus sp. TaxID=41978 RepID=UPI0025F76A73|nr:M48 family metallopeptidase [Ruminococcus sp.]
MKSIKDTDRLTTALSNEGYLHINEHNSKCHRINVVDSNDVTYKLRTHSVSFDLISSENIKRWELIEKGDYLFKKDELPTDNFLPLIKTADGRYAGKMLIYEDEENNFYLGTGRNGSGKSWGIAQIMTMLRMLGHSVVAFDVSGTYTRKKILDRKMLPEEVVDHLFKFITIGDELDNIPVDPLDFKDCKSIDAIRVNIQYIIRSCAGNMTSRWGSCLPSKCIITLNKSLIEAPKCCIEYVVYHEFCHFIHPNHSKQFYSLLQIMLPDWKERKSLLEKYFI